MTWKRSPPLSKQAGRDLLVKLLKEADRREVADPTAVVLPLTRRRAKPYFDHGDPDGRRAIHGLLGLAESDGAVTLEWGSGPSGHKVDRIRLADARRLARFLGVSRGADKAESARLAVEARLPGDAPEWVREILAEFERSWRVHERPDGLGADDPARVAEVFRAVALIAANEHEGMGWRSFGAWLMGDSKFLENHRGAVAAVWKRKNPTDLSVDELLDDFGLRRYPQTLLMRGSVAVVWNRVPVWIRDFRPYVGIPPEAVGEIRPGPKEPSYVLTVENLESFHQYVRRIDDDGLVLYTGGFPGPEFRRVYGILDCVIGSQVPFFHWGDRDVGGVRIFQRLESCLDNHRPLRPHRMDEPGPAWATEREWTKEEAREVGRIAEEAYFDGTADLAEQWLEKGLGKLEQENQEPIPPREQHMDD